MNKIKKEFLATLVNFINELSFEQQENVTECRHLDQKFT